MVTHFFFHRVLFAVNLESLSMEETAAEASTVDDSVDEEDDMLLRLQRLYMKNPILCQPDQPCNVRIKTIKRKKPHEEKVKLVFFNSMNYCNILL